MDEAYRVVVTTDYVDRTEPGLSRTRARVASFEKGLARTEARMRTIGSGLSRFGRSMTRYVTLPIVAAGAASVKMYMDFRKSMTNIRALVGANARQMRMYQRETLELARTVPQGPQALADALYFVTSSGFKGASAMKVLRASSRAAAAGLGDTATVADAVTSAVNAWGEKALSAERATDILLATVREGKAEPAELAGAIGRVIAPAEAMGLTFDEVGAAVGALSLTGLDAAEAVTGFRGILLTLLKPTEQGKKALAGLGTSIEEVQLSLRERGFMQTMMDLRAEFGYTQEEAHELASKPLGELKVALGENYDALGKVFGNVRAINAFLALTGRNVEKNAKLFGELAEAKGDTDRAFQKAKSDPMFQFQRAMSNLKTTLIEVAPTIMPVVEKLVRMVERWAKAIGKMDPSELERWVKILGLLAVVGPVSRIGGGAFNLGAGAIRMFRALSGGGAAVAGVGALGATGAGAGASTIGSAVVRQGVTYGATGSGLLVPGGVSAAAGGGGGAAAGVGLGAGALTSIGAGIGLLILHGVRRTIKENDQERADRRTVREKGMGSKQGRSALQRLGLSLEVNRDRIQAIRNFEAPPGMRGGGPNEETLNKLLEQREEIIRRLERMQARELRREQKGLKDNLFALQSLNGELSREERTRVLQAIAMNDYEKASRIVSDALGEETKKLRSVQDGFQDWSDSAFIAQVRSEGANRALRSIPSSGIDALLAMAGAYDSAADAAQDLADAQNMTDGFQGAGGGNGRGRHRHRGRRHDYPHTARVQGPGVVAFPIGNVSEEITFSGRQGSRGGGGGRSVSVTVAEGAVQIHPERLNEDVIEDVAQMLADKLEEHLSNQGGDDA